MVTKQRFVVAVFSVMISSSVAFCQWENQDSGVSVKLYDVCFVDTLHGWAVGDSSTIITTSNGGNTWSRQESPVENIVFEKVQFLNENTGYIIGSLATILYTKDGGTTWVLSESGIDSTFRCNNLSFINENTGWISCDDLSKTRRKGVILHTDDGGQTWEKQFDTEALGMNGFVSAVAFLDEENGWTTFGYFGDPLEEPAVYKTIDGGQNWIKIGNAPGPIYQMSTVSQDTIWGKDGAFIRSFDGGIKWISDPNTRYVHDILQINGHAGWVVNRIWLGSLRPGSNTILFTNNAGTTWKELLVNEGPTLAAIANAGLHNLWVVGRSGIVLHYKEPLVSVDQIEIQFLEEFDLKQNFPNPFNANTTIDFKVLKRSNFTLSIYDVTGSKVEVLLSNIYNPGNYSITWPGKDKKGHYVSSGIYFFELRSENLTDKKKMLIIR